MRDKVTIKLSLSFKNTCSMEFRKELAASLEESKQAIGRLVEEDRMCCLGRFHETVKGWTAEDMEKCVIPSDCKQDSYIRVEGMDIEDIVVATTDDTDLEKDLFFANLNDGYLTHKEIASLLVEGEVTVDKYVEGGITHHERVRAYNEKISTL